MTQQQILEIQQLQEQKRKVILFFKQYKLYPQFRAIINLMAAVADYTWHLDDVPSLFKVKTIYNPYTNDTIQGKTHIGQFNKEEIESLMEWITKTFKDVRNLVIDKEQNNLTQQEIIDKYYNMVDKYGNIIVSPLLRTIAETPSRLYLMQTYKQLENRTFNPQ
jgi:predicted DCC family thiol-disulfide oxidoreductase YuxK